MSLCKSFKHLGPTEPAFWFGVAHQAHVDISLFQYNKPSETVIPESVDGLQENLDVVVSLAERHYYNCDFKMCYKLTSV